MIVSFALCVRQLQAVESSMRRLDRDERELSRHKQEVTQKINARYDALMTWATRSRDELLEEMSAKEDSARSQLRTEKTAATVTMETLSALVSRAGRGVAEERAAGGAAQRRQAWPPQTEGRETGAVVGVEVWRHWILRSAAGGRAGLHGAGGGGGPCWRQQAPVTERAGGQGGPLDERDDRNQQQRHRQRHQHHRQHRRHSRNHHRHHRQQQQHRREHQQHHVTHGWHDNGEEGRSWNEEDDVINRR